MSDTTSATWKPAAVPAIALASAVLAACGGSGGGAPDRFGEGAGTASIPNGTTTDANGDATLALVPANREPRFDLRGR